MTYAEKLKALRTQAGLTQKALGLACGYDENNADRNVRGWESGKSYPPITMLRALAKALNVPLDTVIP